MDMTGQSPMRKAFARFIRDRQTRWCFAQMLFYFAADFARLHGLWACLPLYSCYMVAWCRWAYILWFDRRENETGTFEGVEPPHGLIRDEADLKAADAIIRR